MDRMPPGLKQLTPALTQFVQAFCIDPFLVQAAAEASPDLAKTPAVDYARLVSQLPRTECDGFLARLVEGEPGVRMALRKRLAAFHEPDPPSQTGRRRTLPQLLQRARQLKKAAKKTDR